MPKGPRKFYFTFEKSGLTRFGGLSLFQVFCRSLQIRRFLQVLVHWPDYDYRGYHPDRKSTRLNSSHQIISYAVFCLKKKNLVHVAPYLETLLGVVDSLRYALS